jgi:hypothetical protein
MDPFDPASPTQMREEKVARWFDRCYLRLVFDRELQYIAIPIEIFSPLLSGNPADALPRLGTESRLIPGPGCEVRDSEVDPRHVVGSPQPIHASKSSPRPFEPTRITIYDPEIVYSLALEAESGR